MVLFLFLGGWVAQLLLQASGVLNGLPCIECPIAKLNRQFHIISCGEAVDLLQPVPKLPIQVPKPIHVVGPVAIEIPLAFDPPLDDQPPSPFSVHVTVS